jgi:hypothetical protein
VEKVKEARESELSIQRQPVEVGDGEEQIGEGGVLAACELGDAGSPFACVHEPTVLRSPCPPGPADSLPPTGPMVRAADRRLAPARVSGWRGGQLEGRLRGDALAALNDLADGLLGARRG